MSLRRALWLVLPIAMTVGCKEEAPPAPSGTATAEAVKAPVATAAPMLPQRPGVPSGGRREGFQRRCRARRIGGAAPVAAVAALGEDAGLPVAAASPSNGAARSTAWGSKRYSWRRAQCAG